MDIVMPRLSGFDSLLRKPGRLTAEEYEQIKQHTFFVTLCTEGRLPPFDLRTDA